MEVILRTGHFHATSRPFRWGDATPADWATLHRPVDYSFANSVHRWIVRVLIIGASGLAVLGISYAFPRYGLLGEVLAIVAFLWLIGGCLWLFRGLMADDPDGPIEYLLAPITLFDDLPSPEFDEVSMVGFLPALGWFGSVALSGVVGLTWPEIAVFWLFAIALVIAVSYRGMAKERASGNPFRGLELSSSHRTAPRAPGSLPPDAQRVDRLVMTRDV